MTSITAQDVKSLRERTGAGMMECKKALTKSGGDMEAAITLMRESGIAKAVKKSGRTAAEGTVVSMLTSDKKKGVLVELNSETDFVAREAQFGDFAQKIAKVALELQSADLETINQAVLGTQTVEEARIALVSKLGENLTLRRVSFLESESGVIGSYTHGSGGVARIGVLISIDTPDIELANDLAMHVAAMSPECVRPEEVSTDRIEKEKAIFQAQMEGELSGKPVDIQEKILSGKISKFINEITLLGQNFVKDPNQTISALLKAKGGNVQSFIRYEVGEGIEKEVGDFAKEVMSQVRGS